MIDAGDFATWLAGALGEADVPCDGCTACCTASQFVLVEPDEHDALAAIPAELLFPAPRMPAGYRVMGYGEDGACPMFVDGRCSIYAARPRACRVYDCRVYAAAGVEPPDAGVAARVRQWRFRDDAAADEVRAAAAGRTGHPTEIAITTIRAFQEPR
jgi:Fe-S-cluster containining protein